MFRSFGLLSQVKISQFFKSEFKHHVKCEAFPYLFFFSNHHSLTHSLKVLMSPMSGTVKKTVNKADIIPALVELMAQGSLKKLVTAFPGSLTLLLFLSLFIRCLNFFIINPLLERHEQFRILFITAFSKFHSRHSTDCCVVGLDFLCDTSEESNKQIK